MENNKKQNDLSFNDNFETLMNQEIEQLGDKYKPEVDDDEDVFEEDENILDEEQNEETNGNEPDEEEDTSGEETPKNSNDEEVKKSEESKKVTKEDDEEKAKRTQNYLNAQKRIEQKKKELEEAEQKGYHKALKENVKGINPYTNKPINDDADLQVYLEMKALDDAGKDPVADYAEFIADKQRKQIEANKIEQAQKEKATQDINDFSVKHPDVNINDLMNDPRFSTIAKRQYGLASLDDIYKDFLEIDAYYQDIIKKESTNKATKKVARMQASMGALENDGAQVPKSYTKMSDENFEKENERIRRMIGARRY